MHDRRHLRITALFASSALLFLFAPTSIAAAKPGAPVVLIGVDGMSFELIEPLIAEGRLPTLSRIMQNGARATLRSERPMRSPALWTTIATGQAREKHGIYDFVTGSDYWPADQRGGPQRLVTSSMRRVPAVWKIAGDAGLSSIVVGWLNTWPAEAIRGTMVAPYVALGQKRQTSIKGKIYEDAPQQTHPASLFNSLRPLVVSPESVTRERVSNLADVPPASSTLFKKVPKLKRYLYTVRWSIANTLTNTAIVERELRRRRDADLVMTYFDGADTLAHRFWIMRESLPTIRKRLAAHGMDPSVAEELKARLDRAVDGYYELVDEMTAKIIAAAGPGATILLVSDHGWGSSGRTKALHDTVPFDGEHRLDGVLIAAGPHIVTGRLEPLSLYDIAPTLLYALGVGVPNELPGRVALELFDKKFAAANPPVLLATQTKSPRPTIADEPKNDAPFVETEIERLRSLGYVQ